MLLSGICTEANEVNEGEIKHRRTSFPLRSSVQNSKSFNRKERKERRDQKAGNTGKEPLAFLSCGRRVLALFSLVLPNFFAVAAFFAANSIPASFPCDLRFKTQAFRRQCGQKSSNPANLRNAPSGHNLPPSLRLRRGKYDQSMAIRPQNTMPVWTSRQKLYDANSAVLTTGKSA